jgi:transcriptional regulator with XRE-family HTH domain
MNTIGENIKNFRVFRKMTQVELGTAVERSKNVVSNWERGDNTPDLDTLEKICRVLNVTPNQIFGWEPCPDYERYLQKKRAINKKIEELNNKKKEIEEALEEAKKLLKDETMPEE